MSRGRPYLRPPTAFWWARRPYLGYTLREAIGVAVAGYGLVLLTGLISLARGRAAYDAWLGFLQTPWSLVMHGVFLIAMVFHVWTWFRIMPKTMPRLVVGGHLIPQRWISAAGLAVAASAFAIALVLAESFKP